MHGPVAIRSFLLDKGKSRRPVVVAAFGARLGELRGEKSAEIVVRQMGQLGVTLTASTLYQYEAGTVNAPDPGVLWALAKIYQVDLDDLIALLVAERNGRPVATHQLIDAENRRRRQLVQQFEILDGADQQFVRKMMNSLRTAKTKRRPRKAGTA